MGLVVGDVRWSFGNEALAHGNAQQGSIAALHQHQHLSHISSNTLRRLHKRTRTSSCIATNLEFATNMLQEKNFFFFFFEKKVFFFLFCLFVPLQKSTPAPQAAACPTCPACERLSIGPAKQGFSSELPKVASLFFHKTKTLLDQQDFKRA